MPVVEPEEPATAATEELATAATEETQPPGKPKPVIPIDQAVRQDAVTCLFCGKRGKTLCGHIRNAHDMDVNEYRTYFGLPKDFPLVAPSYSEKRRGLARKAGLGQSLRKGRKKTPTTLTGNLPGEKE